MSPAPSSTRRKPAWSMPCSTTSRGNCARENSQAHRPARAAAAAAAAGRAVAGLDQSPEERLIARHFRPLATHPGAFGLADDAAVLSVPEGFDLVVTTDGVIAGVHFFFDDAPADVARKALRMNLSDLAAKGAKPLGFIMA